MLRPSSFWKRILPALVLPALLAAGSSASAQDERQFNLQMAMYTGPSGSDAQLYNAWIERVRELTEGSVNIDVFYAGSLLSATDMLDGVGNRRADLGSMSYFYYPAETPLTFLVSVPYVAGTSQSRAIALQRLYETNDAYRAQYEENGVVNLLTMALHSPPVTGCRTPLESFEDLGRQRIRAGGLFATAWEPTGAQAITLPLADVREAMERGLIDCWTGVTLDTAPDFGLQEVSPYLYDTGWGDFGAYELIINKDVWNELSDGQRDAMRQAMSEIVTNSYTPIMDAALRTACEKMSDGAEVLVLPDDIQRQWRELVEADVLNTYYDIAANNNFTREAAEETLRLYVQYIADVEPNATIANSTIARCAAGEL